MQLYESDALFACGDFTYATVYVHHPMVNDAFDLREKYTRNAVPRDLLQG